MTNTAYAHSTSSDPDRQPVARRTLRLSNPDFASIPRDTNPGLDSGDNAQGPK